MIAMSKKISCGFVHIVHNIQYSFKKSLHFLSTFSHNFVKLQLPAFILVAILYVVFKQK